MKTIEMPTAELAQPTADEIYVWYRAEVAARMQDKKDADADKNALKQELARANEALSGRSVSCGSCNELIKALINVYRWTGSKRVARECKRVVPNIAKMV